MLAPAAAHGQGQPDSHPGGGQSAQHQRSNMGSGGSTTTTTNTTATTAPSGCTNPHQADFTGNGANTSGPYDSTCDGRASANGLGTGQATGQPCMGCVGNADNQNPKGQMPNGSDRNAGYECDLNKGVGQGNPAHTNCVGRGGGDGGEVLGASVGGGGGLPGAGADFPYGLATLGSILIYAWRRRSLA